ncbi:nuclear transport factor 2 family protein [Shewanella sp. A25]|nr:nuclear transport factor 2 family protein [Shewanella shenzhenensis]
MRFLLLALICLLSFPSLATTKGKSTTDQLINANYPLFLKAFNELSPEVTGEIYSQDASYLSESQSKEIYYGRESIIAIYQKFFDKIRGKNAHIDVDFRVLNRKVNGNTAIDTGYYLVRFYPAKETGEPVSEFAGKFVIGTQKESNNRWSVSLDMNNRAEPSFYLNAKPVPNLYYGRQFEPLPNSKKTK